MTSSWIVPAVAAAYLVMSLVVGLWPGREQTDSAEGFVAGDRSLGLLVMYFITGATIFSSFAFLGAPGFAYSKGASVFYIVAYGVLGFAPFYFTGPRAARLGRRYGLVTQAEMVAKRFDMPAQARVMAVISVAAFIPYLALQMNGAGIVVEMVTEGAVPSWAGGLVVYAVVTIYVLRSGVLGVGWTNTFQGVFMLVLAWGLGLYLPYKLYGGVQQMFEQIQAVKPSHLLAPGAKWTWGQYTSAVLVSAVGFTMWPHLFMKAFTAKSEKTLRRTVVLYPTFQIFLVPLFLIGFAGVLFDSQPDHPNKILPHMLMNMDLPAVVVGLFCAGALAASMSSGDAMAHAAASIAIRDGYVRGGRRDVAPATERSLIRWVVVAVMIVSYVSALLADHYGVSLVLLLLAAYGPIVQFAPAIYATLYSRTIGGPAVLAGMLVGGAVTLVFQINPTWQPVALHPGLYGLIVNVITLAVVNQLRPPKKIDEEFLEVAKGGGAAES
jgi:SSS family solute:Na+ symporter